MKRLHWIILGAVWLAGIGGALGLVGLHYSAYRDRMLYFDGEKAARVLYERTFERVKAAELPRLTAEYQVKHPGSTPPVDVELWLWLGDGNFGAELSRMTLEQTGLREPPRPSTVIDADQTVASDAFHANEVDATKAAIAWSAISGLAGFVLRGRTANVQLMRRFGAAVGWGLVIVSATAALYVWIIHADQLAMYDLLKAGRGAGGTLAELVSAKSAVNRALVLGLVGFICGGALVFGSWKANQPRPAVPPVTGELA